MKLVIFAAVLAGTYQIMSTNTSRLSALAMTVGVAGLLLVINELRREA